MPISSQLVAINASGIAALVDGTYWHIAPDDLARAEQWIPGAVITVTPSAGAKPDWPFTLSNADTGEQVAARQSKPPPA
jgi:hypothetical protein